MNRFSDVDGVDALVVKFVEELTKIENWFDLSGLAAIIDDANDRCIELLASPPTPTVRLLVQRRNEPTYVEIELPGGGVIAGNIVDVDPKIVTWGSNVFWNTG